MNHAQPQTFIFYLQGFLLVTSIPLFVGGLYLVLQGMIVGLAPMTVAGGLIVAISKVMQ